MQGCFIHLQVAALITACTLLEAGAWHAALGRADLAEKFVLRVLRGESVGCNNRLDSVTSSLAALLLSLHNFDLYRVKAFL